MASGYKRTGAIWEGYANGYYMVVPSLKGRVIPAMVFKATACVVVNANTLDATAFLMPPSLDGIFDIMNAVAPQGFAPFKRSRNILDEHPNGVFYPSKGASIVAKAAADQAWAWLGEIKEINEQTVSTNFKVKVPKGAIRNSHGISFEGYTNRVLKVHGFDSIADTVAKAVGLCESAWNWKVSKLRVMLHGTGSKAMGVAFNCGSGNHRISLNSRLLNEYDLMSIFRVVLHELCHHYRDEMFPVNPLDSHDAIFCRELSKVDSVIADDQRQCQFFTEEQWEGSKVVQQKQAKKEKITKASNYNGSEGYFSLRALKSRELRLDWVPFSSGGFKRKAIKVNFKSMEEIAGGMTAEQQKSIDMLPADKPSARFLSRLDIKNFHSFLTALGRSYPSHGFDRLAK